MEIVFGNLRCDYEFSQSVNPLHPAGGQTDRGHRSVLWGGLSLGRYCRQTGGALSIVREQVAELDLKVSYKDHTMHMNSTFKGSVFFRGRQLEGVVHDLCSALQKEAEFLAET